MNHVLTALIWLFSFWLVWHCIRRRAGFLWVLIILFVPPWGGLLYLLAVRLSDSRRGGHVLGMDRATGAGSPLSLGSPVPAGSSAAPRGREPALDVADQREEQGSYEEAAQIYRHVLEQQPSSPRALHGLARCQIEQNQLKQGVESYEKLMEADPRFRDYSAALEYAEALHRVERTSEAIEMLRGLVGETGRLNHRLALAHYLEAAGELTEARRVLSDALKAYEQAPTEEQVANRHWQRRIVDKLEDTQLS